MGRANAPIARYFARKVGADDAERVGALVAGIPAQLDRVDRLIADGVIGGHEPNAADFQIAATLRVLMTYEDLAPAFEGRPAAAPSPPACCRSTPRWSRLGSCRPSGSSGSRAEDDLQRLALVVDAVGLGSVVELHVVTDQRRRVERPSPSISSTGSTCLITFA